MKRTLIKMNYWFHCWLCDGLYLSEVSNEMDCKTKQAFVAKDEEESCSMSMKIETPKRREAKKQARGRLASCRREFVHEYMNLLVVRSH